MSKKLCFLCLSVVLVSSLVSWANAQPRPTDEMKTLKIGVISPQSGPIAFYGTSILRSVSLAAKNINEKGTLGKGPGVLVGGQRYKLEVVSYDDMGDPAKSIAGMRKLVEMYKVPVILGPIGTPHTWACQAINVQLGVLFLGMSASDLSRKKGNPLYIQDRTPGEYYGDPMAQACINKGYRKACVLSDVSEAYTSWGKRFKDKFESLGGEVLRFESVDTKTTTDFHSIMTSFKAKNPEIIFVSTYEEPSALAARHALDVGYQGRFLFNTEWGPKGEKMVGLENLDGSLVHMTVWYYVKYPSEDKRGYLTAFIKQYRDTYKEDPATPAAHTQTATYMFVRAMEIAGTATDVYAIRAACPKALQEDKLPLVYHQTDVLKNGLMYGMRDVLTEIRGGQYKFVQEIIVPRELLE
jgi:branched-chain amino acid transport system substrate-binding protein